MNRDFVVLIVAVNIFVVAIGGFLAYSDLYLRTYTGATHSDTHVVEVEYVPLGYIPTYEYYEPANSRTMISQGYWTLDFLQAAILTMAIIDITWIYIKQKETKQTTTPTTTYEQNF